MNWKTDFNWAGAIELNREALTRIVAALFAMLGLDGDDATERIAPRLHRVCTAPCCASSGPPNPPSGGSSSLRPAAWW